MEPCLSVLAEGASEEEISVTLGFTLEFSPTGRRYLPGAPYEMQMTVARDQLAQFADALISQLRRLPAS